MKAALLLLALIGMLEFYMAMSGKHALIHCAGYLFAVLYFFFLDSLYNSNSFEIIVTSFVIAVAVITVVLHDITDIRDAAVTFFGFFYVAVLLSTVFLVRNRPGGALFTGVAFISAWGSDTGALIVGKLFGKHKLTPRLSPNKTVEGAVGGVIVAALLTTLFGVLIFQTRETDISSLILKFTLAGSVCAVFSQLGDLFASAVKRNTGIKDFGRLLPGHGGILDRFDSVLFTAPALYIFTLIIIK